MNKLKSRKFWMAVVTGLLIVLNDGMDLGIEQETVLAFSGIIATYIFGEAATDVAKVRKERANADLEIPIEPRV